uniref:KRAB domain-containing protein n=1 Tax=Meleagris gallopavo TaxID=9103 RepID=G1MQT0_MELGA
TASHMEEPVTFEDIAIYLSRAEWDMVAEEQRELYRSVMLDNYELLASLGYPGPKPDILHRLEHGEEPWVNAPQSPVKWDGPDRLFGCNGDKRWLPESCCSRWLDVDKHKVLEKRHTPSHGEQREPWLLRSSRLLKKFGCLEGRSELRSEAASSQPVPEGSQEKAQMGCLTRNSETEHERGVKTELAQSMGNVTSCKRLHNNCIETFQETLQKPHNVLEEVSVFQANREHGKSATKDLTETVLEDHCYCVSNTLHRTQFPHALRDHDYCGNSNSGVSVLRDHEYCKVQRFSYQDRVRKVICRTCRFRAIAYRLSKRKSYVERIIWKAKRSVRFLKPTFKNLRFSRALFCTKCLSVSPVSSVPLARADDSTKETCGAFCPPAEQVTVPQQSQKKEDSQEVTVLPQPEKDSQEEISEAPSDPAAPLESAAASPPPSEAWKVQGVAAQPEALVHQGMQEAELIHEPDTHQNTEGYKIVNTNYVLLHDAYEMVVWTVDHMLESSCQAFELGDYTQCKEMRSVITQSDS